MKDDLIVRGWTEDLMMENSKLLCDECSHPVGEHYFPGGNYELCCDVPYCECRGLQPLDEVKP